jgi:glycosyltransferase involved in cell wall biosynthesis
MIGLLRGDVSRERLKEAGQRQAKEFSWARSAARLREVYQEVVKRPKVGEGRFSVAAD